MAPAFVKGREWSADVIARAEAMEAQGNLRAAADLIDSACMNEPDDGSLARFRTRILNRLEIRELGLVFRYIPRGTFLMGSEPGPSDEQPVHRVTVSGFWLTDVPLSWSAFCRLKGWRPPPDSLPDGGDEDLERYRHQVHASNKIRLQYTEDETLCATAWHLHHPNHPFNNPASTWKAPLWGEALKRSDSALTWSYEQKPGVSFAWLECTELAQSLSNRQARYRLPTEAEWERAARGGLPDSRYPWGNDPPSPVNCDFDRFLELSILKSRRFAPNAYGLYAMSGSVWEWTSDWYQRDYYSESPELDPTGPTTGVRKVLRGGSWADCAEAVTVSFRMPMPAVTLTGKYIPATCTPCIGFRLARDELAHP